MLNQLIRAKEMTDFKVMSLDGPVGHARDFYFDDQNWGLRYLVVDTEKLFTTKDVLLSPQSFESLDMEKKELRLRLSADAVSRAPRVETAMPVSRQNEMELNKYYGWTPYWAPFWGITSIGISAEMMAAHAFSKRRPERKKSDPHLRSMNEVRGYRFVTPQGEMGHLDDFVLDDTDWLVHYLVVDTRNWWPGKKTLIWPFWCDNIDWADSKIYLKLSKETIEKSPPYDPKSKINPDYEKSLHKHYEQATG